MIQGAVVGILTGVLTGAWLIILPSYGVRFYPESIMTAAGHDLLRNYLRRWPISTRPAPRVSRARLLPDRKDNLPGGLL